MTQQQNAGLSNSVTLAPTKEAERINSVDVIRGVALLGILLMNVTGMGLPGAYSDPSAAGGAEGWNLMMFQINSLFFEGTMRGLFSLLFGAGVILFTSKKEASGIGLPVADAWYRRTIWLILFGMVHAYILLWPGDILYSYGLMGLLLFPFRKTNPRQLIIAAVIFVGLGTVWTTVEYFHVTDLSATAIEAQALVDSGEEISKELQDGLDEWSEMLEDRKYSPEKVAEAIEEVHAGYFSAMAHFAKETFYMETYIHYRYDLFDILSMMLLGMALFKMRVLHAAKSTRFYVIMAVAGYGIGVPINWLETSTYINSGFDMVTYYQLNLTYDLGRIAVMFGHIGLVMLICKAGIFQVLLNALAAVGRMALTNYIMHTVFATLVFVFFKQYGMWQRYELYYFVFAVWIFQLVMSPIWLKYYRFGPLEWLWRGLTYGKKPQLKR